MGVERVIGHKEWAGKNQGKWDPGAIDMNIFRGDITARLRNSGEGEDMAAVPQNEWNQVREWIRLCMVELTQPHPSRSPLRLPDDPYRDTMAGYILNGDGHGHLNRVKILASLGHPQSIDLLKKVAALKDNPKYPDRQDDAEVAAQILHEVYSGPNADLIQQSVRAAVSEALAGASLGSTRVSNHTAAVDAVGLADRVSAAAATAASNTVVRALESMSPSANEIAQSVASIMASSPSPAETVVASETPGQRLGRAYDALASLNINEDLTPEDRATMSAMLGILQAKIGATNA